MKNILLAVLLALLTFATNSCLAETAPKAQLIKSHVEKAPAKIRLNQATVEELQLIPGLGRVKAQAIADYIQEHGEIRTETQLTQVKGIGSKLAAKVSQFVAFE